MSLRVNYLNRFLLNSSLILNTWSSTSHGVLFSRRRNSFVYLKLDMHIFNYSLCYVSGVAWRISWIQAPQRSNVRYRRLKCFAIDRSSLSRNFCRSFEYLWAFLPLRKKLSYLEKSNTSWSISQYCQGSVCREKFHPSFLNEQVC